jgi:hypothetical protein
MDCLQIPVVGSFCSLRDVINFSAVCGSAEQVAQSWWEWRTVDHHPSVPVAAASPGRRGRAPRWALRLFLALRPQASRVLFRSNTLERLWANGHVSWSVVRQCVSAPVATLRVLFGPHSFLCQPESIRRLAALDPASVAAVIQRLGVRTFGTTHPLVEHLIKILLFHTRSGQLPAFVDARSHLCLPRIVRMPWALTELLTWSLPVLGALSFECDWVAELLEPAVVSPPQMGLMCTRELCVSVDSAVVRRWLQLGVLRWDDIAVLSVRVLRTLVEFDVELRFALAGRVQLPRFLAQMLQAWAFQPEIDRGNNPWNEGSLATIGDDVVCPTLACAFKTLICFLHLLPLGGFPASRVLATGPDWAELNFAALALYSYCTSWGVMRCLGVPCLERVRRRTPALFLDLFSDPELQKATLVILCPVEVRRVVDALAELQAWGSGHLPEVVAATLATWVLWQWNKTCPLTHRLFRGRGDGSALRTAITTLVKLLGAGSHKTLRGIVLFAPDGKRRYLHFEQLAPYAAVSSWRVLRRVGARVAEGVRGTHPAWFVPLFGSPQLELVVGSRDAADLVGRMVASLGFVAPLFPDHPRRDCARLWPWFSVTTGEGSDLYTQTGEWWSRQGGVAGSFPGALRPLLELGPDVARRALTTSIGAAVLSGVSWIAVLSLSVEKQQLLFPLDPSPSTPYWWVRLGRSFEDVRASTVFELWVCKNGLGSKPVAVPEMKPETD